MKKLIPLAIIATALTAAPAFAKSQGVAAIATVTTGKGGVLGLLDGKGGIAVNANVATGKGGVLGAVLGKGGLLGGVTGCGCH